jgi:arsenate reductase (thioredoxin)
MGIFRTTRSVLVLVVGIALVGCRTVEPAPVLIVCEHGSVKSLIAASLFNQAAAERHLSFRAIARGVNPDSSVPPPISAALAQEGFDVKEFVPTRFSGADVAGASRVIAIGVHPAALSHAANVYR